MDASIRIISRIEPREPVLVAAWPGMGNVAYGAAMYLKENLKAVKCAEIASEGLFYRTGIQINDGVVEIPDLPKSEFFFYRNASGRRDIIIFLGEAQPVLEKEYELARRVVEYAKSCKVAEVVTFAATPVNITHHAEPGVWGVATDRGILQKLPPLDAKIMIAGHIGGLNGLLLGVAMEAGLKGLCLLGEIPFYTAKIENPKSALAVLSVFMKYAGVIVDLSGLMQMAKYVEEEIDRVSRATKQAVSDASASGDAGASGDASASGDAAASVETEASGDVSASGDAAPYAGSGKSSASPRRAKAIPSEAASRIERMFEMASRDITKAGELKKELDRWGVFQEFEDRFLDLFGKKH